MSKKNTIEIVSGNARMKVKVDYDFQDVREINVFIQKATEVLELLKPKNSLKVVPTPKKS